MRRGRVIVRSNRTVEARCRLGALPVAQIGRGGAIPASPGLLFAQWRAAKGIEPSWQAGKGANCGARSHAVRCAYPEAHLPKCAKKRRPRGAPLPPAAPFV